MKSNTTIADIKSKRGKSNPSKSQVKESGIQNWYESIANCSAITGIPVATIRLAKKNGCTGFRGSRVYLLELLRWIFSQEPSEDGIDWGQALKKAQTKREEIKLENERKKTILKTDVHAVISAATSKLFGTLDRQDNAELPSALHGLDKIAIQRELLSAHEKLVKEFLAALDALANQEVKETESESK